MLISFFSQAQTYHIYRIYEEEGGLAGAQILNEIKSDQAVFGDGSRYISQAHQVVYEITGVAGIGFSGLFAHMYIFEFDPEQTEFYRNIGILNEPSGPISEIRQTEDGGWKCFTFGKEDIQKPSESIRVPQGIKIVPNDN